MLRAFQRQLDALAADYDGAFERAVKGRWSGELPRGMIKELKEFICLLPAMERRIYNLYVWLPESSKVKSVGGYFLTYMYEPQDFIPETEKNGLFGYIDDAYLAALFYELMLDEIASTQNFRLKKTDSDLLKRLIRLRRKAAAVIPDEAIKIKEMLGQLFEGDETIYQEIYRERISA